MELHEFLQWGLNFFFIGVIVWQFRESKKPRPLTQTRLPSLHDEKTKALIGSLEKLETEATVKLGKVAQQWSGEVGASKKQLEEQTFSQKQSWENEMQAFKKQWMKEMETMRKQWQTEMIESRVQCEQMIAKLKTSCQEAQKLIQASKLLEFSDNPSLEEKEIKEALSVFEETQIPSVRELEDARARLKRESTLDLKSVLNEQLS